MSKTHKSQPLLLLRNVRYPTYKLWTIAGSINNQETVLIMCTWHAMVSRTLLEPELLEEIVFSSSDAYKEVELSHFGNIHLEVVWLHAKNNWSLQLIEPGLDPNPGMKE